MASICASALRHILVCPRCLQISRLLIGHSNEGLRAGWFLDSVQILVPVHGMQYMFPSHRWLCKDEADGKVEVELYPSEILDIEKCKHNVKTRLRQTASG